MNVAMNSHPGKLECCCRKLAPNWLLQTQLNPRVVQQKLLQKYHVLLVLDKEAAATYSTRNGDLNELQHKGAGRYNRSPCSTVHTSTTKPRLNTGRSSVAGPAEPARSSTRSSPRTNSQASNNNAFVICTAHAVDDAVRARVRDNTPCPGWSRCPGGTVLCMLTVQHTAVRGI